jgi:hypothetical protein
MNPIAVLKRYLANVERSRQMLEEIRAGKLIEITELAAADAKRSSIERRGDETRIDR